MDSRAVPSFINPRDPSFDARHMLRPRPEKRACLDDLYESSNEDDEATSGHGSVCDLTGDEGTVSVYLRLRPTKTLSEHHTYQPYRIDQNTLVAKCLEDDTHRNISERLFQFTGIFSDTVGQREVYERCVRDSIESMDERSATFLTYGTSGSGKTHTLLGDATAPGIVPRALEHIFAQYGGVICADPIYKVDKDRVVALHDDEVEQVLDNLAGVRRSNRLIANGKKSNAKLLETVGAEHQFERRPHPAGTQAFVWISFMEVYNEILQDLLTPEFSERKELKIMSNDGNSYIKNLTAICARNTDEALDILQYGIRRLTYGTTDVNSNSSRSHSVFFVHLLLGNAADEFDWVTYKFCDLAGSERVKKTNNVGKRLQEAQRINKSLMVLGRCLEAVHKNQQQRRQVEVVPVRESRFTLLIQSALLGKERLTMIVNLLPVQDYYEENLNVLNFSSIAKQILLRRREVKHTTRYSLLKSRHASIADEQAAANQSLVLELDRMRDECEMYKAQIVDMRREHELKLLTQETALRKELWDEFDEMRTKREERHEERLNYIKSNAERKEEEMKRELAKRKREFRALERECDALEEENAELRTRLEVTAAMVPSASKKRRLSC